MHVIHAHSMVFAVFKKLKSSFSEDNMPEHALDICIENATKMVKVISLNAKNEDRTLRLGMIIMHLGVIDTVFHSGEAWNPMP